MVESLFLYAGVFLIGAFIGYMIGAIGKLNRDFKEMEDYHRKRIEEINERFFGKDWEKR